MVFLLAILGHSCQNINCSSNCLCCFCAYIVFAILLPNWLKCAAAASCPTHSVHSFLVAAKSSRKNFYKNRASIQNLIFFFLCKFSKFIIFGLNKPIGQSQVTLCIIIAYVMRFERKRLNCCIWVFWPWAANALTLFMQNAFFNALQKVGC